MELGARYLKEIINFAPLSLWHSIWRKDETLLNRQIIRDCLSLDHGLSIPWLAYIRQICLDIGRPELFDSPDCCMNISRSDLRELYLINQATNREILKSNKVTVSFYCFNDGSTGLQPYLSFVSNPQHRFVLSRLRLNLLHLHLCFLLNCFNTSKLPPCPCDGNSMQSIGHFLLFCPFYKAPGAVSYPVF